MHPKILSFTAAVVLALVASAAHAWNAVGHSVVAEIAWQQLSPEQRKEVVDTLKRHPRFGEDFLQQMPRDIETADEATKDRWIFWQAAVWPDVARGIRGPEKKLYDHGTWHYINGPIYVDRSDRRDLAGRLTNNMSAKYPTDMPQDEWNIIQATKHAQAILKDNRTPAPERAVAYCWLFHLVGDSHQPLHSCALFSASRFPKGDRGGNDIPLMQGDKLHSLWDNLLGRGRSVNNIKRRAVELLDRETYGEIIDTAGKKTDIRQWLAESFTLAKDFVYDDAILTVVRRATPQQPIERITLSEDYLKAAGGHARKRVLAAGLRLAVVLKDVAATSPAAFSSGVSGYSPSISMFVAPSATPSATTAIRAELAHWLNTKTGQRHNRECRWFQKTKHGRMCSADEGDPCDQCGG